MRRSREFLAALINAVPVGVVVQDESGRAVMANDAAREVMGVHRERAAGHSAADLLAGAQAAARLAAALADADTGVADVPLHLDGRTGWIHKEQRALVQGDGRRDVISVTPDVTARRQLTDGPDDHRANLTHRRGADA